jgi:DNA polymerase-3 subunit delta
LLAERLYPQTWANRPSNPRYDVPPDLERLANEVAKLTVAAHPDPISRTHVERLVATGDENQVFRFADAAGRGDLSTALAELRKLLEAGEEPFAVVAQLNQQVELAAVLESAAAGRDPAAVGRDLGLTNPARMGAIAASRRGRPPGSAASALGDALEVDRGVKRGALGDPIDALYGLLARAAHAPGPGARRGGR